MKPSLDIRIRSDKLTHMQFESLKVFCDVARYRSFSQAAGANDVTQSAASQIVHQLEKRLGVQLIDRSTRPLQLTALGQRLLRGLQGLVEQYLELEASIRNAQAELAATVQVAAIYSVGLGDMGQYVERFKAMQPEHVGSRRIPAPRPGVREGARRHRRLRAGVVPAAVAQAGRRCRGARRRWCWPAPPSIRWPRPAERPAGAAGGREVRRLRQGPDDPPQVDRFLREQGVAVEVVLEFDNIENIKKAVEVGPAWRCCRSRPCAARCRRGTLVALPLAGCRLVRPLGIIHRRHHKLSPTALRFIELLRGPEDDDSQPPRRTAPQCAARGHEDATVRSNRVQRGRPGSSAPERGAARRCGRSNWP